MGKELIKIGIIGAGHNTKLRHIPGLQAIKNVQIIRVCNRSEQSGQKVAEEFNIPKVDTDWRELVNAPDIDAVVIGTWPYMHSEITIAALQAGKHVLCEARMACNLEQAREMFKASQQNPNLIAQIVPSPMTLDFDKTIIKLIKEDYLGKLLALELRAGNTFINKDAPMHWRYDFNLSGYNTMSLGIWYEALTRWIGPATKVSAMAKTFVNQRKDAQGQIHKIRVPDHLDVIAEMACGARANIRVSDITGLSDESKIYLFGSEGTICLSNNILLGAKRNDKTLQEISIDPELRGKWRVEEEFIGAIRGKEQVKLTTFADGVKYMAFTEAVFESIQTGRTIAVSK